MQNALFCRHQLTKFEVAPHLDGLHPFPIFRRGTATIIHTVMTSKDSATAPNTPPRIAEKVLKFMKKFTNNKPIGTSLINNDHSVTKKNNFIFENICCQTVK